MTTFAHHLSYSESDISKYAESLCRLLHLVPEKRCIHGDGSKPSVSDIFTSISSNCGFCFGQLNGGVSSEYSEMVRKVLAELHY